ncbi:MAG: hypothetical protein QXG10_00030 [Candidatus Hadarchaeales archaeon]
MNARGSGSVHDVLVFATLVSVSLLMLHGASPDYADGGEVRFARDSARGILLIMTTVNVKDLGGFEYGVSFFPFSSEVGLEDRTVAQLVGELWVLRSSSGTVLSDNMEEGIEHMVRDVIQRFMGGRFCYRWRAEVLVPGDGDPVFLLTLENMRDGGHLICSETITAPLSRAPITGDDRCPAAVRMSMELWSA